MPISSGWPARLGSPSLGVGKPIIKASNLKALRTPLKSFLTIFLLPSSDSDRYSGSRDSGPPGAPGGPKYGPPVPGTNYAAMGYSYDNGRDGGPPKDSSSRGGFGDRGGEGGSR